MGFLSLFRKAEERQANVSTSVRDHLLEQATGSGLAPASDTLGVVEAAVGLWARSLSSAEVEPQTRATRVLTAAVLGDIGRALGTSGEYVSLIEITEAGELVLRQSCAWVIEGFLDPESWRYSLELPAPGGVVKRTAMAAQVIHVRINQAPNEPWKGRSPLAISKATSRLASWVERGLTLDSSIPAGQIISVPDGATAQQVTQAENALTTGRGKVSLIETTRAGWGEGQPARPAGDYQQRRFGPEPPATAISLRAAVRSDLLAAYGLSDSIIASTGGSAGREGFRRYLSSTLRPIGDVVQWELALKLDTPNLRLKFAELQANDIGAKARSMKSLVDAGYTKEEAAALVGLA